MLPELSIIRTISFGTVEAKEKQQYKSMKTIVAADENAYFFMALIL
jgi:hypothetical protein